MWERGRGKWAVLYEREVAALEVVWCLDDKWGFGEFRVGIFSLYV